jgi:hypothetical protein
MELIPVALISLTVAFLSYLLILADGKITEMA